MNFTLTIHGETPAELLAALQRLNDPAAPQQPHSAPAAPQEKPKAPAPAKQKKLAEPPAAVPAKKPEPDKQPETPAEQPTPAPEAPVAPPADPEPDPATLGKIRDLARSLIVHGKREEVHQLIASTGAASVSALPAQSYTAVWEQLVRLSEEVDRDAAG